MAADQVTIDLISQVNQSVRFALTGPFFFYPVTIAIYIGSFLADDLKSSDRLMTSDDVYLVFFSFLSVIGILSLIQLKYSEDVDKYLILLQDE